MKRLIASIAMVGALAGVSMIAAAPASAESCNPSVSKTSTSTSVNDYSEECDWVQAGIWRYITVSPTHYVGPEGYASSYVSNGAGTNSGNDVRTNVHPWTFI